MLPGILFLLLALLWPFYVHAQAPFYQGKTIRLVAGTPAGSVYDLYARMVAQFIPKHIPGAPNVIVQNMPGVASMVAANYIYEVAKPDGLTIGSIQPALYFDQLVGRKEVKFDWQKFTWIGNTTVSHHLLYMRSDTPYKTIEDIRKAAVPPKCGEFDTLFTTDRPVLFAYHGYPWLIHRLTYRRQNHHNIHVRGYIEEGTTTTPFDMVMMNNLDRYHLVMDVIDRVPGLGQRAAHVRQRMTDARRRARAYTREHGDDIPEVRDWRWDGAQHTTP
jgi:hypothetical protein